MKSHTMSLLVLLFGTLIAAGCGGEDNPSSPNDPNSPNNPDPGTGTVSFTLGGESRSLDNAVGVYSVSGEILQVSAGANPTQEGVSVVFPREVGTVTLLSTNEYSFIIVVDNTMYTALNAVSSITVTQLTDTRVVGTFTGVVSDFSGAEQPVTDGELEADFVDIP